MIGYASIDICQKDFDHLLSYCDFIFSEISCGIYFNKVEDSKPRVMGFFKYKKIHK